jgi:hypothetical protein
VRTRSAIAQPATPPHVTDTDTDTDTDTTFREPH